MKVLKNSWGTNGEYGDLNAVDVTGTTDLFNLWFGYRVFANQENIWWLPISPVHVNPRLPYVISNQEETWKVALERFGRS